MPYWIHARQCVVRLEVEAVVPEEDPSEPCLEPATLRLIDRLQDLADAGNVDELREHGQVYVRLSASA
ncbi:MAG: hypothetical protein WD118_03675 [Phycisphaeraceae bacterium]